MATETLSPPRTETEARDPWLPMIVIAMGQMLMSFNVSAIPLSMGGMVESFKRLANTSATPEQFTEALQINADARTRALKVGFLVLTCLALLALPLCSWLPNYRPGEVPVR